MTAKSSLTASRLDKMGINSEQYLHAAVASHADM